MPIAGTSMRGWHALKPVWIGRCRRRTRTNGIGMSRIFADRNARPCDLFRRDFPAWPCNVPNSARCIRCPSPRRRREAGMYGAATDCASPTSGRIGKNLCCVPANCEKTDAVSAALPPRSLTSLASSSRRGGQGPHRSHPDRPRGRAGRHGRKRAADSRLPVRAENTRRARSDPAASRHAASAVSSRARS